MCEHLTITVKPKIFGCPSFWRFCLWNYFGARNFGVFLVCWPNILVL